MRIYYDIKQTIRKIYNKGKKMKVWQLGDLKSPLAK